MGTQIRINVDWNKGRAVTYLLNHYQDQRQTPTVGLYLGDDRTDEVTALPPSIPEIPNIDVLIATVKNGRVAWHHEHVCFFLPFFPTHSKNSHSLPLDIAFPPLLLACGDFDFVCCDGETHSLAP